MAIRFLKRIFSRRRKKIMPPPKPSSTTTLTTKTDAWLTSSLTSVSGAITTIGQFGNATSELQMTVRTAESNMTDDVEVMSLTEIMGLVVGLVILITMMVLVCFVYRTKCRTQVKRRQTLSSNERRSAAISMDLMELNDFDQQLRQNAGGRLPPTISSPLYGRENDYSDIKLAEISKQSSSQNGTAMKLENSGKADTDYYSVVLNENEASHGGEEDTDSYINANEVLRHKLEALQETPAETAAAKDKRHEALNNDKPVRTIQDTDDTYDNFHDVDSVELSTPPTPCYDSSSGYMNEWEPLEKGYVNTEFREQHVPLIEHSQDDAKYNCPNKKGKTKNIKDNCQIKKEKSKKDQVCVPQNGDKEVFDEEDQHYLPMDSENVGDMNYMLMDCGIQDADATVDNVYIYMEKNEPVDDDYINCNVVNTVYENSLK